MNRYDNNNRRKNANRDGLIDRLRQTLSGSRLTSNNAGKKAQSAYSHERGKLPPLQGPYPGSVYDSRQVYSQSPLKTANQTRYQSQSQSQPGVPPQAYQNERHPDVYAAQQKPNYPPYPQQAPGYSQQGKSYANQRPGYFQPHPGQGYSQQNAQYQMSSRRSGKPLTKQNAADVVVVIFSIILALTGLVSSSVIVRWLCLILSGIAVVYIFLSSHLKHKTPLTALGAATCILMLILTVMTPAKVGGGPVQTLSAQMSDQPSLQAAVLVTAEPIATIALTAVIIASDPPAVIAATVAPAELAQAASTPMPTVISDSRITHDGISLDMTLFYNPEGGSFYHTRDDCPSVNSKYLPLKGTVVYEQLTMNKFKALKPCTVCSAPVRPHAH